MGDISLDRQRLSNEPQGMVLPRLVFSGPGGVLSPLMVADEAHHRSARVHVRVAGSLRLRWHMRGRWQRFAMSPVHKKGST